MDLSAVMAPEPTVSDVDTDVDVDTGNDFDTDSDVDVDTDIDSDMELDSNTESDIDGKPVKPNKIDLTKTEFKKLPENIKKIFKEQPAIKSMYFQNQEYAKAFESPAKAQQIAETLDMYGGIDSIQNDIKEWSTIDSMFQAGDSTLLDTWTKMSPEGFNKIMPDAIIKYSQGDPEGFAHMSGRIIAQSMDQVGLPQVMQQLYSTLEPGSPAAKIVESIYNNYLQPIYGLAKNAPVKRVDPERQKLQSEREQFETQKQQVFLTDVATEANKIWSDRQTKELSPYLKGRNLTSDQMTMLHSNINAKFKKMLSKDTVAQEQMANLLRSGDKAKYIRYMNSKLDKYMPIAAQQVWRAFNGINSAKVKPTVQPTVKSNSSTPIRVNRIPTPAQIDQAATIQYGKSIGKSYQSVIESGLAVLKNGKLVRFED